MKRHVIHYRHRAIMPTEVVIALGLLMLVVGMATSAIVDYRVAGHTDYWSRAATWAAQAQLQRIQAGAAFDSLPPPSLIPDEIALKTVHEPAQGPWQGFHRVTVAAAAAVPGGRSVRIQVSAYVPAEGRP